MWRSGNRTRRIDEECGSPRIQIQELQLKLIDYGHQAVGGNELESLKADWLDGWIERSNCSG